jgi:tetratricopeptide (TPR) repeat protein
MSADLTPSPLDMTGPHRQRMLVIAIDGLDWGLMQSLVDLGELPHFARWLASGSSGRFAMPSGLGCASFWTTVATGMRPDRHGVLHDLAPRADGLTLGATPAEYVQEATVWHMAAKAGRTPHVAGWPALLRQSDGVPAHGDHGVERGIWVSAGLDHADNATLDQWPLPPGTVWPVAAREEVLDALVHPAEVAASAAAAIASSAPEAEESARELIARWTSIHRLGLAWSEKPEADLIALRYDGLPQWCEVLLPVVGPRLPDALRPCYRWLDLLVGRFMHVLGGKAHMALVTDRGLPNGGYGGRSTTLGCAGGGVLMSGPGVPADGLLPGPRPEDVCPTLIHLLQFHRHDSEVAFDGRNLLAHREGPAHGRHGMPLPVIPPMWPDSPDARETLDWLTTHGVAAIDLTPLRESVATIRRETLARWAQCRRERGAFDDAIAAWRRLLVEQPNDPFPRAAMGEALLAAGRGHECRTLLDGAPESAREPPWDAILSGLVAIGEGNWALAEQRLKALVAERRFPFNIPALLGTGRLRHADWAGALHWFEQAVQWPSINAQVWEGMGLALQGLGRHQDAAAAFGRAIACDSHQASLHSRRAEAWAAAGHVDKALNGWRRALELDPTNKSAQLGLMSLGQSPIASRTS